MSQESQGLQVIRPEDLGTRVKVAVEVSGADEVHYIEPDAEVPFLSVVMDTEAGIRIEVWFEEGEPLTLRLDAKLTSKVSASEPDDGGKLEFALRVLNELNRLESTPWKLWLKGMRVEFEGILADDPPGEVWATWSIPADLVEIDDLPDLCRRFSEGLSGLDIPLSG